VINQHFEGADLYITHPTQLWPFELNTQNLMV